MLRLIVRYSLVVAVSSVALLAVSFPLQPSHAQTQTYSLTISCASSIQACLDAASESDTVVIPAGTYTEGLTLSKAISLTGVNSATTIIHAIAGQRVLTVTGAPISTSIVISGLTLMGGHADTGGGLFTERPATLINLRFISNTALLNGGGLAAETVVVFDSQFIGNAAFDSAIFDSGGEAVSVPSRPTSLTVILRTTPLPGVIEMTDRSARVGVSMPSRSLLLTLSLLVTPLSTAAEPPRGSRTSTAANLSEMWRRTSMVVCLRGYST